MSASGRAGQAPSCRVLIQNVSAQCIPNLVAVQTYRPQEIVWVHTPEVEEVAKRLAAIARGVTRRQRFWRVDAHAPPAIEQAFARGFAGLKRGPVVFHLTGGTKPMSVIGLVQLARWRRKQPGAEQAAEAVVMNPRTQHFDRVFPDVREGVVQCKTLSLQQILQAHGNSIEQNGRSLDELKDAWKVFARLRRRAAETFQALRDGSCERKATEIRCSGRMPDPIRKGLRDLAEIGLLRGLSIRSRGATWRADSPVSNPLQYLGHYWLEDWTGAMLARAFSDWRGGQVGIRVRFGREKAGGVPDIQEFDFLGVRRNKLVYWSCKHVRLLDSSMLFEVDALRDEVGGRDHHVAGLVYWTEVVPGALKVKARRLGLALVDASEEGAEKALKEASS